MYQAGVGVGGSAWPRLTVEPSLGAGPMLGWGWGSNKVDNSEFLLFLAAWCGLWDLSSPTRDLKKYIFIYLAALVLRSLTRDRT